MFFSFFFFLVYWGGCADKLPAWCCWQFLVGVGSTTAQRCFLTYSLSFIFCLSRVQCVCALTGFRVVHFILPAALELFSKDISSFLFTCAPLCTFLTLRKPSLLVSVFLRRGEYHFDLCCLKPHKVCSQACPAETFPTERALRLLITVGKGIFPSTVLCWLSVHAACVQQQQLGK